MPQDALSNLGINTGWTLGEDGWMSGVNNNWLLLDTLVQGRVMGVGLNNPPVLPGDGECYIAGGAPTGAWNAMANKIIIRNAGTWVAFTPLAGWKMFDRNSKGDYEFDGTAWQVRSPLNNWSATADPVGTDDESLGYRVGSQWLNTSTEHVWICCNPADGAAVWKQITA